MNEDGSQVRAPWLQTTKALAWRHERYCEEGMRIEALEWFTDRWCTEFGISGTEWLGIQRCHAA